jgi:hypothetical protein
MHRYLPALTALVALMACGVVHGFWTGRWSEAGPDPVSGTRLEQVPLALGDWQGEVIESPARAPEPGLGQFHRRYKNRHSGAVVSISLVYGQPGPVSIHTPDVCYGASGFEVGTPTHVRPADTTAEFWTAEASRKNATDQTRLRIFWSWCAGGTWQAADNPRLAFPRYRYPVLYKLYAVRELSVGGESPENDPCADLLRYLLPELQKAFVPSLN